MLTYLFIMLGFLVIAGAVQIIPLLIELLKPMSAAELEALAKTPRNPNAANVIKHGPIEPTMICPHCHVKGHVYKKPISKKAGISGAKATGALLTGGVSLLATGLSRKEALTEAHCTNCSSTWHF